MIFVLIYTLQLDCCGWDGPKEFAYNSEPIDDSCYVNLDQGNSGILSRPDADDLFSTKKMKQVSLQVEIWCLQV